MGETGSENLNSTVEQQFNEVSLIPATREGTAVTNKILIIDDDPILSELLSYNLETQGYTVLRAKDGKEGLRQFEQGQPNLVILDLTMPVLNGWEVCKTIREVSNTPIIMLTAQGNENDIVRGLDLGADDYLTKPFQVRILMARIRANLRRAQAESGQQEDSYTYHDDHLTIDLSDHKVLVDGKQVRLTPTEFKLLAYMVKHPGRILESRQILENVWGFEYIDDVDYLRVYIWHLRRKIEPNPKEPIYLLNELNVGYRFHPKRG
jgi:two-component system, OmpR family, KDP operon response regulator KdpE